MANDKKKVINREIKKCFMEIGSLYINTILPIIRNDIYDTYIEYPNVPSCLNYNHWLKNKEKSQSTSKVRQKAKVDNQHVLKKSLEKRNSRYKGKFC